MRSLHLNFLNYVNAVMDLLMVSEWVSATYVRHRRRHSDNTIITGARFYYSNDCVRDASFPRVTIDLCVPLNPIFLHYTGKWTTMPLMRGSIRHVRCVRWFDTAAHVTWKLEPLCFWVRLVWRARISFALWQSWLCTRSSITRTSAGNLRIILWHMWTRSALCIIISALLFAYAYKLIK